MRRRQARRSRTIRCSSCARPATRCSAAGSTTARANTARFTASMRRWAPRSRCRRWFLATLAGPLGRASALPAIPRPANASSTASSCSTPKARTSSLVFARRCRSPSCANRCPRSTTNWRRSRCRSSKPIEMCRISSSRSSPASSICCKPAAANAQAAPRCASRWICSTKVWSMSVAPCAWCSPSISSTCCIRSSRQGRSASCSASACQRARAPRRDGSRSRPKRRSRWPGAGVAVILARVETSPEDIAGMHASAGILTARGGMTSHAAVVARQMGTCCVAGCDAALIDAHAGTLQIGGRAP